MAGKVFISCGQRDRERTVAEQISKLLRDEFDLDPYLAFKTQSLNDIMTITEKLRSSDYYLFVDFLRAQEGGQDLPCSLFTHQELALAHHLGFQEIIALQQKDAPREGFLAYVLSNPERFENESDLIEKLRALVKARGWSPTYSRNLVVSDLRSEDPLSYGDHTGRNTMRVWTVKVENRRMDVAAVRTVCILDEIETPEGRIPSLDRSYLKWSGQLAYERTILPRDYGITCLLCTHETEPGLFLLSQRDEIPREPVVRDNGDYRFHFKIFSEGFPLLKFEVSFTLQWVQPSVSPWDSSTAALAS